MRSHYGVSRGQLTGLAAGLEAAKVVMDPVGILPGSGSPYMASHDRTSFRLPMHGTRVSRAPAARHAGEDTWMEAVRPLDACCDDRRYFLGENCISIDEDEIFLENEPFVMCGQKNFLETVYGLLR